MNPALVLLQIQQQRSKLMRTPLLAAEVKPYKFGHISEKEAYFSGYASNIVEVNPFPGDDPRHVAWENGRKESY